MRIWGKIVGGFFGMLFAGPFGILLGVCIGHFFDRALYQKITDFYSDAARKSFFKNTFLVMGYIAKLDGRISEAEIHAANAVMDRMGLTDQLRKKAIELFTQGKQPGFQLSAALYDLKRTCYHNKTLLRLFLEIQVQTTLAEGHPSQIKRKVLEQISRYLGFTPINFNFFEHLFSFQRQYQRTSQDYREPAPRSRLRIQDAYVILGVRENASNQEIKRAYRKLMSQHHPDRLVAKGLPETMIKLATEKTQNIKAAYELICTQRGI
jgi:DnaJ like chaperone protein